MWQYEYTCDICPLQNNKKIKEICTNIDRLIKNIYKKRLQTFSLHLTIIKRKYTYTLITT